MNAGSGIRIALPLAHGNRVFYPVVREQVITHENGSFVTEHPVALLMQEQESWYFIPLAENVTETVLDKMISFRSMSG